MKKPEVVIEPCLLLAPCQGLGLVRIGFLADEAAVAAYFTAIVFSGEPAVNFDAGEKTAGVVFTKWTFHWYFLLQ